MIRLMIAPLSMNSKNLGVTRSRSISGYVTWSSIKAKNLIKIFIHLKQRIVNDPLPINRPVKPSGRFLIKHNSKDFTTGLKPRPLM